MRRILLFTLFCLIGCLHIAANPITVSQAQQKAGQFLNKRVAKKARASAPKAKALKMMAAGKNDSYYIFNVGDDGGFVVVSGDDATEEILGYSDTGSIDPDNMPCGMRMLLDSYADQIKFLRENGITKEQNKSARKAPAITSFHIDEERLAKYDQGEPYNNLCPRLGISDLWEHCATGCAATALSELMYFYQWPNQITSEIPGYTTKTKQFTIDAIPANTTIDWGNIIRQYNEYYPQESYNKRHPLWETDEEADAIANLMKMAGAAVHMDYDESSSAYNVNLPFALKKYFGYETAKMYSRSSYTDEEWDNMLSTELVNNIPIIYYGKNDDNEGHFFILEGYMYENGFYYYNINFGADGRKDNNFILNVVEGDFDFTNIQCAILDVKPQSSLSPVEIPLRLSTSGFEYVGSFLHSQSSNQFDNITLWARLRNLTPIDTYFDHGFRFVPFDNVNQTTKDILIGENMWMQSLGKNGQNGLDTDEDGGYQDGVEYSFTIGNDILDGEYKINCISKETGTNTWYDNEYNKIVYVVICNGKLAFFANKDRVPLLDLFDFTQTSEAQLRVGQPSDFCYILENIVNSYVDLYDGYVWAVVEWKEGDVVKEKPIFIEEIQVPSQGRSGVKGFSFSPPVAGEQDIVFYNMNWEEIDRQTVTAISATQSLDLLEVTSLTLRDGDMDLGLIDGTSIRGTLYIKNNDAVTKKANVIIGLTDVETQAVRTKPVSVTIAPNSTVGYSFGFGNLTDGHHYIVTASYASGTEFYHSVNLLCTTAGMGETESGNEALSGYEYWFDDNVDGRQWVSLSGNNAVIRASIDTHGLSGGLHRFNFRVKRSDGAYSAVTTSTFLNLKAENQSRIVYWFDENCDNYESTSLADTEAEQEVTLNLQDLEKFPLGFHQLNMRVATPGKSLSNVYSARVLKMASGDANQIEYWIDGDYEHTRKTVSGHVASYDDKYMIFTDPFDLSEVSAGMHRIYYRAVSQNGLSSTAVSMTPVMVGGGEATQLEYWFDGDREKHKGTLTGSAADGTEKAYNFEQDLNLEALSEGMHRMYYRAVNSNGVTASAVSMTPVMVKSMYAEDYSSPKILGYSIAVDNDTPRIREFSTPKSIVDMEHVLNARSLSVGNHKVKAKFWNTAYAGVSVEQQFKVLAPVVPTLTLTAQEQNGVVNLKFDAVPNDLRYRTIRVDANGAKAKVDSKEGGSYPATISYNDNPAAGTYTYYVQTAYTDYLGEQHSLKSNEVTVNVHEPLTEVEAAVEYGYITGRIVCDKNTPTYGVKVRFSPDNETASVSGVNFARTKIPVGTQLTLTVEGDDSHDYEPLTVTVKAGANDVTLRGTLREEYQPNNLANDLAIAAPLQLSEENERYYVKFSVKNLSHDNDWQGIIRVKAIDKVKADKQDTDLATASFEEKNLYIGESDYVKIGYNATKEVNIFLRGLKVKKDTEFYLYLESQGKWEDTDDAEEAKPLEPSSKYDVADNPVVRTILKPAGELKWKDVREDFSYAMLGVASLTPGMNGIVGDLSSYEKPMTEFAKQFTQKTDALEAGKALVAWLQDKTALEVINEWGWNQGTSGALTIFKTLKDIFCPNKSILQKFRKDMIVTTEQIGDANDVLSAFVSLYEGVTAKNSFDAVMGCANTIYTAAAFGGGAPVGSMMYAYSVVGKSLIESARAFGPIMNSRYITTRLKANKVYNGTDEGRQNTAVDFKLIVRRKALLGCKDIDFTKDNNFKQIKNISIKAALNPGQEPAEFRFTLEPMKDGVMLKTDGKGITNGKWLDDQNELKVLYMEIQWANDRTTMIPLIQNTNGVNIDIEGANIHNNLDNFEANKPVVYTVTLTTETGEDKMADEIYLGSNKNE